MGGTIRCEESLLGGAAFVVELAAPGPRRALAVPRRAREG